MNDILLWGIFMANIIAVKLNQRMESSTQFQEILSKYGCNIKTRIGLHEVSDNVCSQEGVILLDVIGNKEKITSLICELNSINELIVKTIEI